MLKGEDVSSNDESGSDGGGGSGGGCVMNYTTDFNYGWLLLLSIPFFMYIRRKA
jgi:hypothetical protein